MELDEAQIRYIAKRICMHGWETYEYEDVLQETRLAAWLNRDQPDKRRLYMATLRDMLDDRRKRFGKSGAKAAVSYAHHVSEWGYDLNGESRCPIYSIPTPEPERGRDAKAIVERLLRYLQPRERGVIMATLKGIPMARYREVLGVSESRACYLRRRAIQRMRATAA